jgi:hypothetical protein
MHVCIAAGSCSMTRDYILAPAVAFRLVITVAPLTGAPQVTTSHFYL